MGKWTELLNQYYSTGDTVPMVKVENDMLHLRQGDDLIVLDVRQFGQFTDGVWAVITASREEAGAARLREARR